MNAKVAVATASGKAYFLLINELKNRNIQFISAIPGETLPAEAKVVITTKNEMLLVENKRVLVFEPETEPSHIVDQAVRILGGKEDYERIVVGIDPGDVFGLAVVADGRVTETRNCFDRAEVTNFVKGLVKNVDFERTAVTIKIGNGVPAHVDLLKDMNSELALEVTLEVVDEAGTNRPFIDHRRGLRDIISATRISGRSGTVYPRETADNPLQ
jgi:hypothetical protein